MSHTVECVACGHVGKTKNKGSIFILILLLIFFFPIAIIYWLFTRNSKVCSACGSSNVRLYKPNSRVKEQVIFANAPNNSELKDCPFCAEQIRANAIKCKHCGSDLSV